MNFNFSNVVKKPENNEVGFKNPSSLSQPVFGSTGTTAAQPNVGFGFGGQAPSGENKPSIGFSNMNFGSIQNPTSGSAAQTSENIGFAALKNNVSSSNNANNFNFKLPSTSGTGFNAAPSTTGASNQLFNFNKPASAEPRGENVSPIMKKEPVVGGIVGAPKTETKDVSGQGAGASVSENKPQSNSLFNFQPNTTAKTETKFNFNSATTKVAENTEITATAVKLDSEKPAAPQVIPTNTLVGANKLEEPKTAKEELKQAQKQPENTKSSEQIISEQRKRYDELQKALKDINVIGETVPESNEKLELQDEVITQVTDAVNGVFDVMEKRLSGIFTTLTQHVQDQVKEYVQQETNTLIEETINQQQLEKQIYNKIQRDLQAITDDINTFKANWTKQQQTYLDSLRLLLEKRDSKQQFKDIFDVQNIVLIFIAALFIALIPKFIRT